MWYRARPGSFAKIRRVFHYAVSGNMFMHSWPGLGWQLRITDWEFFVVVNYPSGDKLEWNSTEENVYRELLLIGTSFISIERQKVLPDGSNDLIGLLDAGKVRRSLIWPVLSHDWREMWHSNRRSCDTYCSESPLMKYKPPGIAGGKWVD